MHAIERPIAALSAVAVLLVLTGCAGVSPYAVPEATSRAPSPGPTSPRDRRSSPGRAIAELATKQVGVPYRYGGSDPREGFDCSGLVFYTYGQAGFAVPRNSQDLFKAASKISLEGATEGDLVFFQDQKKLSHVGIYLGDGQFVHAPSSGRTVDISTLDSAYYREHLVGIGRLLPD